MSGRCVATLLIGPAHEAVAAVSLPYLARYATRRRAELVVVRRSDFPQAPMFGKLAVAGLLADFGRVAYFDLDCLVRPDCPDLFDLVPADRLGAFDEAAAQGRLDWRLDGMRRVAARQGTEAPAAGDARYWNAGMFVAGRGHAAVFVAPPFSPDGSDCEDQHWWNLQTRRLDTPLYSLPDCFNSMPVWRRPDYRRTAFVLHHAGLREPASIAAEMARDVRMWRDYPGEGQSDARNSSTGPAAS